MDNVFSYFDITICLKFFISLFALINPVGILPVFISMTGNKTINETNKINLTASITVAIIIWIALLFGDSFLVVFGVSINSFRIAGGILLSLIAITMVNGKIGEHKQNEQESSASEVKSYGNIGVVPLALPLMAGPGAISSTIVWGVRYSHWYELLSLCITGGIFAGCCWGLYRCAPVIIKLLGQTGINVITRIMGLMLMALGIEFVIISLQNIFPGLVN